MPRPDAYETDPLREQEAEDFVANLSPWLASLQAAKDAGDKLFEQFGAGTSEGEYLDGVLDGLDDAVKHARNRLASDAAAIAAGRLDVPTSRRRAA